MSARWLLNEDVRWKAGNGLIIGITEKWIPKPKSFQLALGHCTLEFNLKVAYLIDLVGRRWKLELLRGRVCDEDLQAIKRILVSLYPRSDK